MIALTKVSRNLAGILFYILFSILLTSCSDDDDLNNNKFDHTHSEKIDIKKHLFEHEFAQQCIANKTVTLVNKDGNRERLAESCLCVAMYLFKDLAVKESYTLLNNKKQAKLLRTKYEDAVSHCL